MLSKEIFKYKISISKNDYISFETENNLDSKEKIINMSKYSNFISYFFRIKSKQEVELIIKTLQELGDNLWPTQKK